MLLLLYHYNCHYYYYYYHHYYYYYYVILVFLVLLLLLLFIMLYYYYCYYYNNFFLNYDDDDDDYYYCGRSPVLPARSVCGHRSQRPPAPQWRLVRVGQRVVRLLSLLWGRGSRPQEEMRQPEVRLNVCACYW